MQNRACDLQCKNLSTQTIENDQVFVDTLRFFLFFQESAFCSSIAITTWLGPQFVSGVLKIKDSYKIKGCRPL